MQLQSLLQSLHPQLNIDAAIANLHANGQSNAPPIDFEDAQAQIETDRDQPAHEFEWHETSLPLDSGSPGDLRIKDGMATLSTLDAGYLGMSSLSIDNRKTMLRLYREQLRFKFTSGNCLDAPGAGHAKRL